MEKRRVNLTLPIETVEKIEVLVNFNQDFSERVEELIKKGIETEDKNHNAPFFTCARRIYRANPRVTNDQILQNLTGDHFLIASSAVLEELEQFGFICKKCKSLATIISVDFTRRSKPVIFFFLECEKCHARGFRKVPILETLKDYARAYDHEKRKVIFLQHGHPVKTRSYKIAEVDK